MQEDSATIIRSITAFPKQTAAVLNNTAEAELQDPTLVTAAQDFNLTLVSTQSGDGSTDVTAAVNWYFIVLGVVPLWILFGNLLVLVAVVSQRHLRTLSNYVIASLAFTDFLLALVVVPPGIYQLVAGRWAVGLLSCLVWTGSDVFLSTTSIMHLGAIAIHRYLAISYPMRMRSLQETRHVIALLTPAWICSFCISLPLVVQGWYHEEQVLLLDPMTSQPVCGIFDYTFAVYSSVVSFFLPLAIMIFADVRSVQILRNTNSLGAVTSTAEGGHNRRTSASTPTSGGTREPLELSPTSTQSTFSTRCFAQEPLSPCDLDQDSIEVISAAPPAQMRRNDFTRNLRRQNGSENDVISGSGISERSTPLLTPSISSRNSVSSKLRLTQQTSQAKPAKSMNYFAMLADRGVAKINSREKRAEKTLFVVFICFVTFWCPFFVTNLTYGICRDGCHIPPTLFQLFTWLGYISSGVNPVIYSMLNRDFRRAFLRILCHQRRTSEQSRRMNTS